MEQLSVAELGRACSSASERDRIGKKERRARLRILLNDAELRQVERAVAESGAPSRSFLVFEAIRFGLLNANASAVSGRRRERIDLRVPYKMKEQAKQFVSTHNLTEQNVLRHFLFRYIAAEPWRMSSTSRREATVEPIKVSP